MGGMQSQSMEVLKYFEKEWEYIQTNPQGIKIFRNRDNDKEAQAHNVAIDPHHNLIKEYDIYNYRRTQDNALVKVYAVHNLKDKSPHLCGNRDVLKVMVEHVPTRGSEITNLAFKEGIYVLSQAIRGYEDCYSKVGYFEVNDRMIGLNKSGNLKVWLSDNFAQNHPSHEKPILQITTANQLRSKTEKEQQLMLGEVVAMVEPKCKQPFPQDFRKLMQNQTNFVDAYQAIEDYCRVNQIDVPDRILMEKGSTEHISETLQDHLLRKTTSVPNYSSGIEPKGKVQSSDFSFNHQQQPKIKLKHNERDTFINDLTISEKRNNNSYLPVSYQSQPSFQTNSSYSPHISWNQISHSPLKVNPHQSLYTYPHQPGNLRFPDPKISLRPNPPEAFNRGPSPALSPRGINFNYQSVARNGSVNRTNYVTSTRY